MKRLTAALLPILLILTHTSHAQNLKSIPIQENGITTAYVSVPADVRCNVKIPDVPTAFCAGSGNRIYHLTGTFLQNPVNPQQYFNSILQQLTAENPESEIINQYRVPEITQHMMQRDSQLIYKNGQQVVTYAFDILDAQSNEKSSAAIVISSLPNNGAPVTNVDIIGFTAPMSGSRDFTGVRREMIRFARTYQFDRGWVQSANSQHQQFLNNQTVKQNAFMANQQRIHQSNMDALDRSHNSYMERSAASDRAHSNYMNNSAASDRSHSSYIDSIHEREQMIDTSTGARYETEGYYDNNYVNPNDSTMYYQTNDPMDNPNMNLNQGENYNRLQRYDGNY
ncbi:MAG: hypothetical protein N0C81_13635 [Candidatus Thiodiazotropha lotti]|uniref:Uncharacterized protein n=1 Tax=Candidatus Thiodiazotropha lotti TaxID=2792787 RepID=A0A9E4N1D9_9GAMM|nr:hypothetical protein [Candidatus Thiodiazotropha lotti]ODC01351.1 hypothetical protein A3197_02390 [Candidatus Thiodiazotropha endoloripes]MCG7932253.1 hypothetical protein [Candidatus Thiodiazotropha lotti]MCG7940203.1 hypothetical protein [Candidatus Thiodiazotropha lotti]MCG7989707.1 hypothetical protein [Candidatus Thiodiazotropha lotti]